VGVPSAPGALAQLQVMLSRSVIAYRPHPTHSPAHRDFTVSAYTRCLAVRERLGDLRVVPGFRGSFLPGMPPSTIPGSSDIDRVQYSSRCRHGPSPKSERLGTPNSPAIRFTRGVRFRGFLFRICCGLPGCSPPLGGSDQVIPGHRGLIHPGFRRLGRPRRRWTSLRQPLDSSVGGTLIHWNER
jgi:hypothetical protein